MYKPVAIMYTNTHLHSLNTDASHKIQKENKIQASTNHFISHHLLSLGLHINMLGKVLPISKDCMMVFHGSRHFVIAIYSRNHIHTFPNLDFVPHLSQVVLWEMITVSDHILNSIFREMTGERLNHRIKLRHGTSLPQG